MREEVVSYEEADVVVKQVMEQLSEVGLDDLLAYADTLDNNHTLRDDPFTRYDVCGVITRCLIMHSDVCRTADEVVKEFADYDTGRESKIIPNKKARYHDHEQVSFVSLGIMTELPRYLITYTDGTNESVSKKDEHIEQLLAEKPRGVRARAYNQEN